MDQERVDFGLSSICIVVCFDTFSLLMVRLRSKIEWSKAIGAAEKSKRLHLVRNFNGIYECPILICDHNGFFSQRGCRKHVFNKHGWYYYFDERPDILEAFPEDKTRISSYKLPSRCQTRNMPSFEMSCAFGKNMVKWLTSDGGGGKTLAQSKQITQRVLKLLRYCCDDADKDWEIPTNVVDFCMGSVDLLGNFFEHLRNDIGMAPAGCIGYLNALGHLMDFRKLGGISENVRKTLYVTEIYASRIRRTISKRMKLEWNTVLDIDNLESHGCWATFEDMQKVIPFHKENYEMIISQCKDADNTVLPHNLSFATSFVTALLFLEVKASRPMTYQHLTVKMVESIKGEGIIDQTIFKTSNKYGFDSLVFNEEVLKLIKEYIDHVRPRLNPQSDYLLLTRSGKQMSKLSSMLGKMSFDAIGKYIHPTRLRQIIETSSSERLSLEDQKIISADQKHTSKVAEVHYKKLRSREVAVKAKSCMEKMKSCSISTDQSEILEIGVSTSDCEMEDDSDTGRTNETVMDSSSFSKVLNCPQVEEDCTITKVTKSIKKGFSRQEDLCIKKGVQKYGWGQWQQILKDPDYEFHTNRGTNTIQKRATLLKQKGFISDS